MIPVHEMRAFAAEFYTRQPTSYLLGKLLMYSAARLTRTAPASVLQTAMQLPISRVIRNSFFGNFCGGETIEEALQLRHKLSKANVNVILDLIGEANAKDDVYSAYRDRALPHVASMDPESDFVSIKLSLLLDANRLAAFSKHLETFDEPETMWALTQFNDQMAQDVVALMGRLHEVLLLYKVTVDAESSEYQRAIAFISRLLIREFNKTKALVYPTYQSYFRDSSDQFIQDLQKARLAGHVFAAKLVRGAYLSHEKKIGNGRICGTIEETHEQYNIMIKACATEANLQPGAIVVATHNEQSIMKAFDANEYGIFSFAQLLGMRDYITYYLAHKNQHVMKYVPFGPSSHAIPYLLRRAEENASMFDSLTFEKSIIRQALQRRLIAF